MKKDINYYPGDFSGRKNEVFEGLVLIPDNKGKDFDDIFKNSNCQNCHFKNIKVIGGEQRENAWDANHFTKNNIYENLYLEASKQPAVYLKGGFCNNVINNLEMTKSRGLYDWYEGDYAGPYREKNKNNKYNLIKRSDGRPVRVVWNYFGAEKPKFVNSKIKYRYIISFFLTLYVEGKYILMKVINSI